MKIIIQIPSSTYDSSSNFLLKNADECDLEVLLTIDSAEGQQAIYVLKKDLINAVSKFIGEDTK